MTPHCGDCGALLTYTGCTAPRCDGWGCEWCGNGCDVDGRENESRCLAALIAEAIDVPEGPVIVDVPLPPCRIQRQRTRGWRMPEGAVYVGRGSRWGNPFRVDGLTVTAPGGQTWRPPDREAAHRRAVTLFASYLEQVPELVAEARRVLAGHDLACWCPPHFACHADLWLSLTNPALALAS